MAERHETRQRSNSKTNERKRERTIRQHTHQGIPTSKHERKQFPKIDGSKPKETQQPIHQTQDPKMEGNFPVNRSRTEKEILREK